MHNKNEEITIEQKLTRLRHQRVSSMFTFLSFRSFFFCLTRRKTSKLKSHVFIFFLSIFSVVNVTSNKIQSCYNAWHIAYKNRNIMKCSNRLKKFSPAVFKNVPRHVAWRSKWNGKCWQSKQLRVACLVNVNELLNGKRYFCDRSDC